jgi:DNA-binding beta-propeller fold protein YncE
MKLVKHLSVALAGAGLMILAAATEAKSLTLTYDKTIGSAGFGPGQLLVPQGITVDDKTGNVYVSDGGNNRVNIYNQSGNFLSSFGSTGSGPGQFNEPLDLKFSPVTGNLYVGEDNNRIDEFTPQGNFITSFGTFGTLNPGDVFFGPGGLSFDKSGNLYVTDFSNDVIKEYDPNNNLIKTIGSKGTAPGQFIGPAGLSVSPVSGNIFVADQYNNRIEELTPDGQPVLTFGGPGSGPGEFQQPIGVEVDEQENIYVGDSINSRVQVFDKNGNFLTSYGQPVANAGPPPSGVPPIPTGPVAPDQFNWAAGAHYDNGKLYVGDFFDSQIKVLDVNKTAVPEPSAGLEVALLGVGAAATAMLKKQKAKAIKKA